MRCPDLKRDGFELRSGEAIHVENPDTFFIPSVRERYSLEPGQFVKLIFDIETVDEDGEAMVQGERMWVLVTGKCDDFYIGMLDNDPVSVDPHGDQYLIHGAEIPFLPGHVINIEEPPDDVERLLREWKPTRVWPREEE
ncbi:MAG: hypothetical protein QNK37_24245 [Acidobacteriota bacterium]|nr:hypothetical protein [Acidobacteriota bacterium]